MLFKFLTLVHLCAAFPFKCPEPAQWSIRAKSLCPDPSKFSCLKNDLINGYSENCTISDFQQPGRKGVLRGGLDADICSSVRYQPWPINYYTNVSTNCIFLKTACNEEGQLVYDPGNRTTDTTCRCDFTRGYTFLAKPRNPCFCVPLQEDCSCYIQTCFDSTYILSPDYDCADVKMNTSTAQCKPISRERVDTKGNDTHLEDISRKENATMLVQRKIYYRVTVTAVSISFIIVFIIYGTVERFSCEASSKPISGHIIEDESEKKKADETNDEITSTTSCIAIKDETLKGSFDKDTQKMQMEEFQKVIDEMTSQVDQLKSGTPIYSDWVKSITDLKKWKEEDDKYFINTTASTIVLDCIKKHVCVSVVGPSGVGKTFLVHHVALELEKVGYTIIKVDSPDELKKFFRSNTKTLFFVDDMCGNYTANKEKIGIWKNSMNDIAEMLDNTSCKLIFTCRLQVFQDEGFNCLKLFQTCICNLVDDNLLLTEADKTQFAKRYFKDIDLEKLKHLFQYNFFPFLCKLYAIRDQQNFKEEIFLKDPFAFCKDEFDNLFLECKTKFAVLLLLVLCNNHIKKKDITSEDVKIMNILKVIEDKCFRNQHKLHVGMLIYELDILTRSFVSAKEGVYHAAHDKLFDYLAFYFGNRFCDLVIKLADHNFINERFVIDEPDLTIDTEGMEYVIALQNDSLNRYIERVFDDMTNSDDVITYLWSIRNGKNKTFQSKLSSFMSKLEPRRVKEVIESGSTSFVQVLCVMTEDDIKESSPDVGKRYGIKIPDDVIKVYIQRVFDGIIKSNDINEYINCNRNKRNTIFYSKLLKHMSRLAESKIKQLIDTASQDFIDRLCVLTIGNIKENCDFEYERYGVIIPEECVTSYIARWFHGMKSSQDIEHYFERNRNRKTLQFQKSLQKFMTELKPDKIKNLIQKASDDFLHKLFITKKEDRVDDGLKEYEHHGIIIPSEQLHMYNRKILSLMKRPTTFVPAMKCNRNIRSVLEYINKLEISRVTDLIKTASDDVFHNMITVDMKHELNLETIVQHFLNMKDGFITCQGSLIKPYLNRMVFDWREGKIKAVIKNNNLKNPSFVNMFLEHLNQLGPDNISELVQIKNDSNRTALLVCCDDNEVILAKWCLESCWHDNKELEHSCLCALLMLAVHNNKIEEDFLNDKTMKLNQAISCFNQIHTIKKSILAADIKKVLDTSLNKIINKTYGRYHVHNSNVFNFLVFYIASIKQMSNILTEYADENVLCKIFLLENIAEKKQSFFIHLSENELQRCIERVFMVMPQSEEMISYVLKRNNNINVKSLNAYIRKLNKEEIKTLINTSCMYFINNMSVLAPEEKDEDSNVEIEPHIIIPDDYVSIYLKRLFDPLVKSDCVEACLQQNRNKKNKNFHKNFTKFFKAINRDIVQKLIKEASSDFINRMFVISEETILDESYWEYERYGIVVPEDLLQAYIERVFVDLRKSVYELENRNAKNTTFRDKLNSYTSSFSEKTLETLIKKANIKFVSRMFLSNNRYFEDKPSRSFDFNFMFISRQKYPDIFQLWHSRSCGSLSNHCHVSIYKNKTSPFVGISYDHERNPDVMITTKRNIELILYSFQRRPIFSNNTIECNFRYSQSFLEKYIQQMIAEWADGNVHDVLGNINLSDCTFLREFLTVIRKTDNATKYKLAQMIDKKNGDTPLVVSCYVGIVELVEWCLTNCDSTSKFSEHPLYIACSQNHPEIVRFLLNNTYITDVNVESGVPSKTSLCLACLKGYKEIVSILLEKNANVNLCSSFSGKTPLYLACKYRHNDIVSLLLEHKADEIDINAGRDKHSVGKTITTTPLYVACKKGNTSIVNLLLNHDEDEVDVNKHAIERQTPLYAACQLGHKDIVSLLLTHKPEKIFVNKSRVDGASPLYVACLEGHTEVVSSLLDHKGIELDKCTLAGMSPLSIASLLGHTKIVEMLLIRSADSNICMKNKETVQYEYRKNTEKYKFDYARVFDYENYIKFIRQLVYDNAAYHVKSYIDVMKEDWVCNLIFGSSPLHMGCGIGQNEIVKLLVDVKSNINCQNNNGSTPLFLACELGHEKIVRVLLDKGANASLERKDRKSPISIASDNGHIKIIEMIKEYITVEG